MALTWTLRDEDVIQRCQECVDNCRRYCTNPTSWVSLCLRMYQELESNGLIHRVTTTQTVCQDCVWKEGEGCKHRFERAFINPETGELRACAQKTTQAEQEKRLELLHGKKKRA